MSMEDIYFRYANGERYDWVDRNHTRTPEKYPYSFDAHYLWRDDLSESTSVYSDRMWQWDHEAAKYAFSNNQRGRRSREECKDIIKKYYKGVYECVGYALCCNQSNGYEIGIFFIKKV